MSTSYRPLKEISAQDLFDGRLEEPGDKGARGGRQQRKKQCLTDGRNYLWVYIDERGNISDLVRYAPNGAPGKIMNAIGQVFETYIASEYEAKYWGFDTEEEMGGISGKAFQGS
jgi:hypothetical protein